MELAGRVKKRAGGRAVVFQTFRIRRYSTGVMEEDIFILIIDPFEFVNTTSFPKTSLGLLSRIYVEMLTGSEDEVIEDVRSGNDDSRL